LPVPIQENSAVPAPGDSDRGDQAGTASSYAPQHPRDCAPSGRGIALDPAGLRLADRDGIFGTRDHFPAPIENHGFEDRASNIDTEQKSHGLDELKVDPKPPKIIEAAFDAVDWIVRWLVFDQKNTVELHFAQQRRVIKIVVADSTRNPPWTVPAPILEMAVVDTTVEQRESTTAVVWRDRFQVAGIPVESNTRRQLSQQALECIRFGGNGVLVHRGAIALRDAAVGLDGNSQVEFGAECIGVRKRRQHPLPDRLSHLCCGGKSSEQPYLSCATTVGELDLTQSFCDHVPVRGSVGQREIVFEAAARRRDTVLGRERAEFCDLSIVEFARQTARLTAADAKLERPKAKLSRDAEVFGNRQFTKAPFSTTDLHRKNGGTPKCGVPPARLNR